MGPPLEQSMPVREGPGTDRARTRSLAESALPPYTWSGVWGDAIISRGQPAPTKLCLLLRKRGLSLQMLELGLVQSGRPRPGAGRRSGGLRCRM